MPGADQLFSGLANQQARLLAFIDMFWALQILGGAARVLLLIHRFSPHTGGNAPVAAVEHVTAAIAT